VPTEAFGVENSVTRCARAAPIGDAAGARQARPLLDLADALQQSPNLALKRGGGERFL